MRHLDVGEEHVGRLARDEIERDASVARSPDDFDVALDLQQRRERAEHHRLIFGDDDANHARRSVRRTGRAESRS